MLEESEKTKNDAYSIEKYDFDRFELGHFVKEKTQKIKCVKKVMIK